MKAPRKAANDVQGSGLSFLHGGTGACRNVNDSGRAGTGGEEGWDGILPPYGGDLTDLRVDPQMAVEWKRQSREFPSWELNLRQLCDLELLLNGGFSPLRGFMVRGEYERVCRDGLLENGMLWPMPVVLDVAPAWVRDVGAGARVALRDPEGVMLAVLTVADIWQPDRTAEAELVYGTSDRDHPGVALLMQPAGERLYVGGSVQGLQLPAHDDFPGMRRTPHQLRCWFRMQGWRRVIAFQADAMMHRAEVQLTIQAAQGHEAHLLIHPTTGMARPGDGEHFCRVRGYRAVMGYYPAGVAELSLLPLVRRMAGPREAVWRAIIARNYGCSHIMVGAEAVATGAGGGGGGRQEDLAAAWERVRQQAGEVGIMAVPFPRQVHAPALGRLGPIQAIPSGWQTMDLTDADLRRLLQEGRELPDGYTFPEVVAELRRRHPPRWEQGLTVFFTGLSGSGKSTLARALLARLLERGGRTVSLLDGDLVRKQLSSELGFSREHRDLNILRIGYVANEITKHGGIALCAPIAPYAAIRLAVRRLISEQGGFVLVYLSTPLEVCEQRDRKGLYAKARAGRIPEFTGISDPYEVPTDADLVLDTTGMSVESGCQRILDQLQELGYLEVEEAWKARDEGLRSGEARLGSTSGLEPCWII